MDVEIIELALESAVIINILVSIVIIFTERRDPRIVWAWLLVLNLMPIVGFFLYLFIGMDFYKNRLFREKGITDEMRKVALKQEALINKDKLNLPDKELHRFQDLILYNLEVSDAVFTQNNKLTIFTHGEDKFQALLKDISEAKSYIHLQYYIIQKDGLWEKISKELMKKAQEGVQVRVLFDGMGSRKISGEKTKELQAKGIEVGEFFPPLFGKLHLRINYRNHRKIVVIDSKVAYVGGFNIGKEYLGQVKKYGYWRDTHLRVEGGGVATLAVRFALDWNYAVRGNLFGDNTLFQLPVYENTGDNGVQIISSGPDSKDQQIRDNYLRFIHKAKHRVYIQTPYFVPDEAILTALKVVAKSGVDVRIMIPCKPDHPLVYWATYSYVGELVEAGAKCYVYENGFLHAKVMTVDGLVCCCGTANMDIRSFKLNFEVNAVVYGAKFCEEMEEKFLRDMEVCHILSREKYQTRSLWVKCKEGVARLFSPVL